jgi:acetyl-CoA carboxylase carboxyltransferase component
VIGGGAAATVVFTREVRARAAADPRVRQLKDALGTAPTREARAAFDGAMEEAVLRERAALAAEFDAIHSVARAREVGSLDDIVDPAEMRPYLIRQLAAATTRAGSDREPRRWRRRHGGEAPLEEA